MGKLYNRLLVIAAFFTLLFSNSDSQWLADVRLTTDPSSSVTSGSNARCVAVSGNYIHVVWWDLRNSNREIYYRRSTNAGVSWEDEKRLTNDPGVSYNPSIAAAGSTIHVVWQDDRDGNNEIYYKRSTNNGVSWGTDTRLTNNTYYSLHPCVAAYGNYAHIVWEDNRDGNYEIYHKRSTNGGLGWTMDSRLTNAPGNSGYPSIAVSEDHLYLVWEDDRSGNYDVYFKRSENSGYNWSADNRLTINTVFSGNPSVSVSGQAPAMNVHIVWSDESYLNYEIHYKSSINGGVTWAAEKRLTNNSESSSYPSVIAIDPIIHIVWEDNRNGNWEIYYKRSLDTGRTWGPDTRLTDDTASSNSASISISDAAPQSSVHVVWTDRRSGNRDIFYKRNPTGNSIGIKKMGTEVPIGFSLLQNYPNPFNPTTKIRFEIPPAGQKQAYDVQMKVFDILGKEIAVVVNEKLKPGIYEAEWNGGNFPSGIYYYRLTAGDFLMAKKMMLIK